jgi:hypothetical protein
MCRNRARDFDSQPRLADPAWSRQGHDSCVRKGQPLPQDFQLGLSAQERRHWQRD